MKFMDEIIKDIEDLRINRAGERHGYFTISGTPNDDWFGIDVIDICKTLAPYEIDYEIADGDELPDGKDEYGWERDDYAERYINYLIELGYIEDWCDAQGNNSYNWSAPVSNDINFYTFKSLIDDSIYVLFKVHRFGDVRCNYTDNCILKFDYDYEFYEAIDSEYKTVEIDGIEYEITISFWSEGFEVFDTNGEYICTVYNIDKDNIIEEIKENLTKQQ